MSFWHVVTLLLVEVPERQHPFWTRLSVPLHRACPGLSLDHAVPLPLSSGTKRNWGAASAIKKQSAAWKGDCREFNRALFTELPTKAAREGWCHTQRQWKALMTLAGSHQEGTY